MKAVSAPKNARIPITVADKAIMLKTAKHDCRIAADAFCEATDVRKTEAIPSDELSVFFRRNEAIHSKAVSRFFFPALIVLEGDAEIMVHDMAGLVKKREPECI